MSNQSNLTTGDHTPGPWWSDGACILGGEPPNRRNLLFVLRHPLGTSNLIPDEELEVNARLIAAAPDLLAVLKEVRRKLRVPPTKEGEETFQMIVAAIAKAEGR